MVKVHMAILLTNAVSVMGTDILAMSWMKSGLVKSGIGFDAAPIGSEVKAGSGTILGPYHSSPIWTVSAADRSSRRFWLVEGDDGGDEDGDLAGQYMHEVQVATDGSYTVKDPVKLNGTTGEVFGLHWDSSTQRLVGVANAFDAVSPVAIDPATGAASKLGPNVDPLGPVKTWGVTAFDPDEGVVWMAMDTGEDPLALMRVPLDGSTATLVQCSDSIKHLASMGFDTKTGGLWLVGDIDGDAAMVAVDQGSCAIQSKLVLKAKGGGSFKEGIIAFHAEGHRAYVYAGSLYNVDLAKQSATVVKVSGFQEMSLMSIEVVASDDSEAAVSEQAWRSFKAAYGKRYGAADEAPRRAIFAENLLRARAMTDGAEYGASPFADLTEAEFASRHAAGPHFQRHAAQRESLPRAAALASASEVLAAEATGVDWRTLGAVTPVKDQGSCGACWAFSVIGNVEGQWFLAGHNLTSLSEQQLVECDKNYGDNGCGGGWPPHAYRYGEATGGFVGEVAYPYTSGGGSGGGHCKFSSNVVAAHIDGYSVLPSDEGQLLTWLGTNGPISIGVNAGLGWQLYRGGVMKSCAAKNPDHGVLIVGYGTDAEKGAYWLVKNSWGSTWGEAGYIRLAYGINSCNLVNLPTTAIVSKPAFLQV